MKNKKPSCRREEGFFIEVFIEIKKALKITILQVWGYICQVMLDSDKA
jgi:hypothetical protein